jgi:arginase
MIGLARTLRTLGCEVTDRGNLILSAHFHPQSVRHGGRAWRASKVARWLSSLSSAAYEFARGEQVPVFLGGDHSLAMGTVAGIACACAERQRELFVLWLDAHPDFNTPATSLSGNLHGMSLAFLCGEPGFEGVLPAPVHPLDPSKVFLLGIRSVDAGEDELIRRRGVNMVEMREIRQRGVVAIMQCILETVAKRDGVLHVSLDADFVDPASVAAVNVPVPDGVSFADAHLIMQMLRQSGRVLSLDTVEFNPLLDIERKSARAIAGLITSLFDQTIEVPDDYPTAQNGLIPAPLS